MANLWLLGEGKVRKWNGTNWTADLGPFPQSDVSVTTMLETSSGRLVVGTLQSGLFVHDPASGLVAAWIAPTGCRRIGCAADGRSRAESVGGHQGRPGVVAGTQGDDAQSAG
jgi:hypothetical protein